MAYIVKDVDIDSYSDYITDKTKTTVRVTLECTHGQASDLLKGVSNDNLVYITVPAGSTAQIIAAVKTKLKELQDHKRQEMELFDQLHGIQLEG